VQPPAVIAMLLTGLSLAYLVFLLLRDLTRFANGHPILPNNRLAMDVDQTSLMLFRGCFYALFLLAHIMILTGAYSMLTLRSYKLAVASMILCMIPCLSPCLVLGVPVGVWGLVVLCMANVRQAFQTADRWD